MYNYLSRFVSRGVASFWVQGGRGLILGATPSKTSTNGHHGNPSPDDFAIEIVAAQNTAALETRKGSPQSVKTRDANGFDLLWRERAEEADRKHNIPSGRKRFIRAQSRMYMIACSAEDRAVALLQHQQNIWQPAENDQWRPQNELTPFAQSRKRIGKFYSNFGDKKGSVRRDSNPWLRSSQSEVFLVGLPQFLYPLRKRINVGDKPELPPQSRYRCLKFHWVPTYFRKTFSIIFQYCTTLKNFHASFSFIFRKLIHICTTVSAVKNKIWSKWLNLEFPYFFNTVCPFWQNSILLNRVETLASSASGSNAPTGRPPPFVPRRTTAKYQMQMTI